MRPRASTRSGCSSRSASWPSCPSGSVKRADEPGRVAVQEVMINTPTVQKLIEDDKTGALGKAIEDSATFYKMQSFNQALLAHITARTISVEEALAVSPNANDLRVPPAGARDARSPAPPRRRAVRWSARTVSAAGHGSRAVDL